MIRRTFPLVAVLAVAALPAAAQDPSTTGALPAYVEAEDGALSVVALGLSVDELEDLAIVGPAGEEIGEVEEALMTPDGTIDAVAAEVGGFLGIGESEVVIPLDRLRLDGGRLVTAMTREELERLPEWDD